MLLRKRAARGVLDELTEPRLPREHLRVHREQVALHAAAWLLVKPFQALDDGKVRGANAEKRWQIQLWLLPIEVAFAVDGADQV